MMIRRLIGFVCLLLVALVLPTAPGVSFSASPQEIAAHIREAMRLQNAGDLAGAEQIARQAMSEAYTRKSKRELTVALAQSVLGNILVAQGRFDEAEPLLRDALSLMEKKYGLGSADSVSPLAALGGLYLRQGRFEEAIGAFSQAANIAAKNYGTNSLDVAEMLNSVGATQYRIGQSDAAEQTFLRVINIASKNGQKGLDILASASNNVGQIYFSQRKYNEAFNAYKDAYDANVKVYGADSPAAMLNLMNAGVMYRDTGYFDDAQKMLSTVLDFRLRMVGRDHPETALVENNLGWLELARNSPGAAAGHFRNAVKAYLHVRALQIRGIRGQGAGVEEREVNRSVLGLLKALAALPQGSAVVDEAFQAAQGIRMSEAATSLTRAGARVAAGDPQLADTLREGQDLANQWQDIDATLTVALALPPGRRNAKLERKARARLGEINAQMDAIDAEIASRFPAYSSITDPQPAPLAQVQKLLGADEAVVLITTFGDSNGSGTFVWVVTSTNAKWVTSDTSKVELANMVWTLRCGLDTQASGTADCKSRIGETAPGALPRFNAKISHALFGALFRGAEELIAEKTLLIVASDPMASLPFQVLVTKEPVQEFPQTQSELRAVSWLGRESPISVFPSVAALTVLRAQAKRDVAPEVYVGIGDPALTGNRDCPEGEAVAACPDPSAPASIQKALLQRAVKDVGALYKSGKVDVDAVRSLCPLPDTATELRCVASSIGAPSQSVYVGQNATLATVRQLDIKKFRIIHFATHGLVAGELSSTDGTLGEPALVLTPPATATDSDDGLLKQSDILNLRLNADWVILSACNTAAGKRSGGEALSGLGSAFLYAGARALLASHWAVSSDAAVRLTTAAMQELAKDPALGRAEALRRSMIALLDHGGETDAHPLIWAPFSVIGEGGQGRP